MSRPVLLLLDPVGFRRTLFAGVLEEDFDLLTPRSMKEVRQQLQEQLPDVVLASIQQHKGNALELCTRLRGQEGGDCLMVVHGSAPEGADIQEMREGLGSRYRVDYWLSNDASPALVALTLKELLKGHQATRPRRERRPSAPQETPSGRQLAADPTLRTTGEFEVEFIRSDEDA